MTPSNATLSPQRRLSASLALLAEVLTKMRPIDEQSAAAVRKAAARIDALDGDDAALPRALFVADLEREARAAMDLAREIAKLHADKEKSVRRVVRERCDDVVTKALAVCSELGGAAAATISDD